jgi:alpha-tubulin suppressor-like RCC1 family protein
VLLDNKKVRCWGSGAMGELGAGSTETIGDNEYPSLQPVVNVGGDVLEISAGGHQTCAVLADHTVRCWGQGSDGRLGQGTVNIGDNEVPAQTQVVSVGGAVKHISTGAHHTCAVLANGTVRCWGRGTDGRLGYGNIITIGDNETPASAGNVLIGGAALEVRAGGLHTCTRLSNDTLRCWGGAHVGQLGYGNFMTIGDTEVPTQVGVVPW